MFCIIVIIVRNVLKFTLNGVNVSLANALRRIILSEIPTAVFRTFPYKENMADFEVNTTRFNNEIVKQRLSCIPIYEIHNQDVPIDNFTVVIDKKNDTDIVEFITTEDFKVKDNKTDMFLNDTAVRKIFPPSPITKDYIDFIRLRPKISDEIDGEHLKMTCKLQEGRAVEDGAYNVVSTCSYGFTPNASKMKEMWKLKEKELVASKISDKDIEYMEKDWYLLDGLRYIVPDSFDFTIETIGVYSCTDIVQKATQIMIHKLESFGSAIRAQKVSIKTSETTMDNSVDITLVNEDYTLGKVIEYMLYKAHYEGDETLTYCGFRKAHPHDTDSIVRLAFKDLIDVGIIQEYIYSACEEAINIYQNLYTEFDS